MKMVAASYPELATYQLECETLPVEPLVILSTVCDKVTEGWERDF